MSTDVYFLTMYTIQCGTDIELLQIFLNKTEKLGKFVWKNWEIFQKSSNLTQILMFTGQI